MDSATFVYLVLPAVFLVSCAVMGGLGAYVARQKGRSVHEGAILGVLFSLVGVVIEALLPARLSE